MIPSTVWGAGVWSRNATNAYSRGPRIKAGRVWTKLLSLGYPAHAAFGGYKQSGFGRETHKDDPRPLPTDKNLLVSYSRRRWDSLNDAEGNASRDGCTASALHFLCNSKAAWISQTGEPMEKNPNCQQNSYFWHTLREPSSPQKVNSSSWLNCPKLT